MRPSPVLANRSHTFAGAPTSINTAKLLSGVNDRLPAHDGGNSQGLAAYCANHPQPALNGMHNALLNFPGPIFTRLARAKDQVSTVD